MEMDNIVYNIVCNLDYLKQKSGNMIRKLIEFRLPDQKMISVGRRTAQWKFEIE